MKRIGLDRVCVKASYKCVSAACKSKQALQQKKRNCA